MTVTLEEETEVAAAYDPASDGNWRQALEAMEETYSYEVYLTAVYRRMK